MKLWPQWALWPRFRRWCHLISRLAHLDPHRAITMTRPILLTTLSVECDCGKVFWKNPDFNRPPSYDGWVI